MQKIPLRNLQRESVIVICIVLVMSALMIYWALQGGFEIRIFGAYMDEETSIVFMYLVAIIPFLFGILKIIDVISLKKLAHEFVITLTDRAITYPYSAGRFKGFQIAKIPKDHLLYAKSFHSGQHKNVIHLKDHNHEIIGVIPHHEICDSRKIDSKDLEKKINDWLDNYDIIDPSLF